MADERDQNQFDETEGKENQQTTGQQGQQAEFGQQGQQTGGLAAQQSMAGTPRRSRPSETAIARILDKSQAIFESITE